MREYRFRAWDTELKFFCDPSVYFVGMDGFVWFNNCADGEDQMIEQAAKLIIMQFTGLRDKNGKEIYEGDIVSAEIYSNEKPSILEVRESQGCFVIDYEDADSDFCPVGWFVGSIEVIGNIYEHSHLLEAVP